MSKEEINFLEFVEAMLKLQKAGIPVPENFDVAMALKKAGFKGL